MEKLESEYPTEEQIKDTLEAYRKGGDTLMELIRKRREELEAAESTAEITQILPSLHQQCPDELQVSQYS